MASQPTLRDLQEQVREFKKYTPSLNRKYLMQSVCLIMYCRHLLGGIEHPEQASEVSYFFDITAKAIGGAKDRDGRANEATNQDSGQACFDRVFHYLDNVRSGKNWSWHPRGKKLQELQVRMNEMRHKDNKIREKEDKLLLMLEAKKKNSPRQRTVTVKIQEQANMSSTLCEKHITLGSNECLTAALWLICDPKIADFKLEIEFNPHFYSDLSEDLLKKLHSKLPALSMWEPIKCQVLYVVCDRRYRIYCQNGEQRMAYGNHWKKGQKVVLKNICGDLEDTNGIALTGEMQYWSRNGSEPVGAEQRTSSWENFLDAIEANINLVATASRGLESTVARAMHAEETEYFVTQACSDSRPPAFWFDPVKQRSTHTGKDLRGKSLSAENPPTMAVSGTAPFPASEVSKKLGETQPDGHSSPNPALGKAGETPENASPLENTQAAIQDPAQNETNLHSALNNGVSVVIKDLHPSGSGKMVQTGIDPRLEAHDTEPKQDSVPANPKKPADADKKTKKKGWFTRNIIDPLSRAFIAQK